VKKKRMITNKMLEILDEVAKAVAIAIGDYKKANEFLDILEAAKGLDSKKGKR